MRRVINCPSYFEGEAVDILGAGSEWGFTTDKDIKTAFNEYNTTALEELNCSAVFTDTITAEFATNYMQQLVDPTPNAGNQVVWHYDISVTGVAGQLGLIVTPYVCQLEDADADTTAWQTLSHVGCGNQVADSVFNMHAEGEVVREKNSVSGAEDTNNLIFGILFWNTSASNCTLEAMISMNIYPITKPLRMIDPSV